LTGFNDGFLSQDLQNCIDKIDVIDYYQTKEVKGIKFTPTPAGHVLGAAMFTIEIDNIRVLYTGDYSLEQDRHLPAAEVPGGGPPDVLIVESTFGTTSVPARNKRELDFTSAVESIVMRGGSCLIPVFALGRAQELLLILDEYWKEHPKLQHIPIFYASKLATRSLRVYQTFVNMMNDHVRKLNDRFVNPFKLRHIKSIQNMESPDIFSPSVVMASPGFLQSGISRQLFEAWCDDERHGVIIAGYTIEGTLANDLLNMPNEIKCQDNRIKPRRCSIESITFSAHVDYKQNQTFIKSVTPDYIVLVHGEKTQMKRLKDALENEMKKNLWPGDHRPLIAMPENCIKVKLRFRKNIVARVVGTASQLMSKNMEISREDEEESGGGSGGGAVAVPEKCLVVTENFQSQIVLANELSQFTSCRYGMILEKFILPIPQDCLSHLISLFASSSTGEEFDRVILNLLQSQLINVFQSVEYDSINQSLLLEKLVLITCVYPPPAYLAENPHFSEVKGITTGVEVTWTASPLADLIADSVAGLLTNLFSATNLLRLNPPGVKTPEKQPSSPRTSTGRRKVATNPVEYETMKEKLAKGEIDPFQKISLDNTLVDQSDQLEQLQQKLEKYPRFYDYFSAVSLNQEKNKLILRGAPGTEYHFDEENQKIRLLPALEKMDSEDLPEAYCFILFDEKEEGGGKESQHHSAVVSSDDEQFQKVVCFVFRQLV
jgi:Cft2 family RNA processing exonuclease